MRFGSQFGGQWTLIGTRSNIIVSDFLRQQTGQGIAFFDSASLGAPVFTLAAIFLLLVGAPAPEPLHDPPVVPVTEFLTTIIVPEGSKCIGATVRDIELLASGGFSVIALVREGQRYPTGVTLSADDELVVRGPADEIHSAIKSPDKELHVSIRFHLFRRTHDKSAANVIHAGRTPV